MKHHFLKGGGGVQLHVVEAGYSHQPTILFIHGFSQSHLAWQKQLNSLLADNFRLIAVDLRGHGKSDKPLEAENYTNPQLWADDINAIIKQLELHHPVLSGWSYGGYVICDYLRFYGQEEISGIHLVGAATKMGTKESGKMLGKEFISLMPGFFATDVNESLAAITRLLELSTAKPISIPDFYTLLGSNMVVPPAIRKGLFTRTCDNDDLLSKLKVPALITHGTEDKVILMAEAEHHAKIIAEARTSYYNEVGHSPFLENPARFNSELMEFVKEVSQ